MKMLTDKDLRGWLQDPGATEGAYKNEGPLSVWIGRRRITFTARCRLHGKLERFTFGHYVTEDRASDIPAELSKHTRLGLALARRYARKIQLDCSKGIDPRRPTQDAPEEYASVEEMFVAYLESPTGQVLRDWREVNRLLRNCLPDSLMLAHPAKVTRTDVREAVEAYRQQVRSRGGDGAAVSNRLLSSIGAAYKWAADKRVVPESPATGIKRYRVKSRSRVLTGQEIWHLWHACSEHFERTGSVVGPFLQLRLLTGARQNDLVERRWRDIRVDWDDGADRANVDFAETAWLHIRETKVTGESHKVFLSCQAMEIIRSLPGDTPWILPGKDGARPISEIKTARNQIKKAAGIPTWVPGDLRKTLATWMPRIGILPAMVSVCLGHSEMYGQGGAAKITNEAYIDTSVYWHYAQNAWRKWGSKVQELVTHSSPRNVPDDSTHLVTKLSA